MNGICFKEPLFHLTVQGIKKQTRRIIKPQPDNIRSINTELCEHPGYELSKKPWPYNGAHHFLMHEGKYINPRYKVGETVYLKEPYYVHEMSNPFVAYTWSEVAYKYGEDPDVIEYMEDLLGIEKWGNKLFMPDKYARHFIKITAVRAERLQDISEEDCIKEGIRRDEEGFKNGVVFNKRKHFLYGCEHAYGSAKMAYRGLIEHIHGFGVWEENPLMWVYDYELAEN